MMYSDLGIEYITKKDPKINLATEDDFGIYYTHNVFLK